MQPQRQHPHRHPTPRSLFSRNVMRRPRARATRDWAAEAGAGPLKREPGALPCGHVICETCIDEKGGEPPPGLANLPLTSHTRRGGLTTITAC